ncbi:MAG: coenzyme F420-0:L-glutamate ligase, partial [Anaerolineales bacterium]
MPIELTAIPGIPLIQPGDDLPGILLHAARLAGLTFQNRDVLVVVQKIVSKAEGRLVDLQTVTPSPKAEALASYSRKDPRLVELIVRESNEVLRVRPDVIVVEHRAGFVCANAGIDQSNATAPDGGSSRGPWVLLLPEDSDRSAQQLRTAIRDETGADIAVIISDSHGRAWRLGTVGVAIGVAGLQPLGDLRGQPDLAGRPL